MDENIRKLQDWIDESQNIVFFGGAGVSTESGIPDFRSTDGLYHQQYDYPPETILSHTFFEKNPAEFYRFYRDKMIVQGAKPNAAHLKLAELERAGKLKAVVTQNIDGLHQAAGSKVVYELHGSTLRNYCTRCRKKYPLSFIAESTGVPHCTEPNSSSAGPRWWSTRQPASSTTTPGRSWCSSTNPPPAWTTGRTWPSAPRSERSSPRSP